ncbi:hypothetical protein P7K49_028587, partial [Saguinus oedipus]
NRAVLRGWVHSVIEVASSLSKEQMEAAPHTPLVSPETLEGWVEVEPTADLESRKTVEKMAGNED